MFDVIRVTRPSIYSFLPPEAQVGLSQGLFEKLVAEKTAIVLVLQSEDESGLDCLLIGEMRTTSVCLSKIWLRQGTPQVWLDKMLQLIGAWGEINGAKVMWIEIEAHDKDNNLAQVLTQLGMKSTKTTVRYESTLNPG